MSATFPLLNTRQTSTILDLLIESSMMITRYIIRAGGDTPLLSTALKTKHLTAQAEPEPFLLERTKHRHHQVRPYMIRHTGLRVLLPTPDLALDITRNAAVVCMEGHQA